MNGTRRIGRRGFLRAVGAAGAGLAVTGALRPVPSRAEPSRSDLEGQPRIAIVGAGLAGLRCAHRLWTERGLVSTIYEAPDAVGGRCRTLRGFFSDGQLVEQGGQFVSSEHRAMRRLVAQLGLDLADVNRYPKGTKDVYFVDGGVYTYAQANADWFDAYPAFRKAAKAAPWPQRFDRHTDAGVELDRTPVPAWLDANVDGGSTGRFGALMLQNVVSEYGGDPEDQPALNLIYLLADNPRGHLNPLAGTDERWHVVGGNDQVVAGLVEALPHGAVRRGRALVALRARGDGAYVCTFETAAGATDDVVADHVVLALPFSTLRSVDLTRAGFSALKMRAITTMGMGTNAKIHLQFTTPMWHGLGYDGTTYTDTGAFTAWDEGIDQPGAAGLLIDFPGGSFGASLGGPVHGIAPTSRVEATLNALEPVFPGITGAFNGRAYQDWWAADPWHLGAYSYWGLGQYTGFSGIERRREGNVHFCGEHTSYNAQGYMEGAVRTGAQAAAEI